MDGQDNEINLLSIVFDKNFTFVREMHFAYIARSYEEIRRLTGNKTMKQWRSFFASYNLFSRIYFIIRSLTLFEQSNQMKNFSRILNHQITILNFTLHL